MPPKTFLGPLCSRQHDWQGSGKSLRRASNRGCWQCFKEGQARRAHHRQPRRTGQRSKRQQAQTFRTNGHVSTSAHRRADQAPPPDRRPGQALAALPAGTTLGALCLFKHYHDGLPFSLRRQSDSRCVTCELLPDGMREVAFLSADLCAVASHRWRGTAWTLRYLHERPDCVQCSAQSKVSRNGQAVVQAAD